MATITTIQGTDVIATSRTTINTNFANLNSDKIETSYLDTDDTLAANSDTKIPSQKAVKAYVDTGGNVNASETTKGIVEEATDAEVTAGTATGATGAKLFITPTKLATRLSAFPNVAIPAFAQDIALSTNELSASFVVSAGSMTDGSAFFIRQLGNALIHRFARDSITGQFRETHSVTPSIVVPAGTSGQIINIGNYIYLFTNDTTNIVCSRFLAADLTGEQAMTVPEVACVDIVGAWTDGVSAYVCSNASDTTSRKWTLSGTTFSASSTATVTTNKLESGEGAFWDGTTAYVPRTNILHKLLNIDGSSLSSTTYIKPLLSDIQPPAFFINIDTTRMYIGFLYLLYTAGGVMSSRISLTPLSKP